MPDTVVAEDEADMPVCGLLMGSERLTSRQLRSGAVACAKPVPVRFPPRPAADSEGAELLVFCAAPSAETGVTTRPGVMRAAGGRVEETAVGGAPRSGPEGPDRPEGVGPCDARKCGASVCISLSPLRTLRLREKRKGRQWMEKERERED